MKAAAIIATRTLKLHQDGVAHDISIRIFAPEHEAGDWSCRWEIDWPDGTRKSAAHGNDSVQALELGLKMVGAVLYASAHHQAGRLSSGNSWHGYGFPVPNNIRDLLIGDDAKYF